MPRPTLFTNRKFVRLSRLLGASYRAVGVLEMTWRLGYESGDPVVGTRDDVEFAVGWDGESGECANAMIESGLLDELDDGSLVIHDFWDHAPDYVRKRRTREAERRETGAKLAKSDRSVTGQCPPNGAERQHSHSHTHSHTHIKNPHTPYKDIQHFWNEKVAAVAGLPAAEVMTSPRKRLVKKIVDQYGPEKVYKVLETIPRSDFLCGRKNGCDWRCDFNWVFNEKNFVKVLEGNYDNRQPQQSLYDKNGWLIDQKPGVPLTEEELNMGRGYE